MDKSGWLSTGFWEPVDKVWITYVLYAVRLLLSYYPAGEGFEGFLGDVRVFSVYFLCGR